MILNYINKSSQKVLAPEKIIKTDIILIINETQRNASSHITLDTTSDNKNTAKPNKIIAISNDNNLIPFIQNHPY